MGSSSAACQTDFLSGQDIHNSASALGSWNHTSRMAFALALDFPQIQRAAVEQNDNHIRVNGQHFVEQLHLDFRHIDHGYELVASPLCR